MHLNITRSQSEEGKKGNLWQGPIFIILVHLVTWEVSCSQPVCGDVEAAGKYEVLKYTIHFLDRIF